MKELPFFFFETSGTTYPTTPRHIPQDFTP